MLNKLLSRQVSVFWPFIKISLEMSSNDDVDIASPNQILKWLLDGSFTCWVGMDENDKVGNFFITAPVRAVGSMSMDLVIYHFGECDSMSIEFHKKCFDVLMRYAKANGFGRIMTYTKEGDSLDLAKQLGGDLSTVFITWDV